jgi:hypothetical protein
MMSYRIKRRAFLAGLGGAVGLRTVLGNLEASAQGMKSPPRFLMMHWPVGTVRYNFLPSGSGSSYTMSRILKPFEDRGLKDDVSILYGLSLNGVNPGGGGGHEGGTPMMSTGADCPGTRRNGGEPDDSCAGGPSWDQILLNRVPDLQRSGIGYVNAICDARVDSLETSTQCISYSYGKRTIASERPGGDIMENVPLLPTLSPLQLYLNVFSGFMTGGGSQETLLRALKARKSVLDYSLAELRKIHALAPASERSKLEFHEQAVRAVELQLSELIESGGGFVCNLPEKPDSSLQGLVGSRTDFGKPATSVADDETHAAIGRAHMSVIRTAFQCDLLRVATFQFSPGTNHVSFKGMYPDNPAAIYMHHPLSHRITNRDHVLASAPGGEAASVAEYLTRVHTWYNDRMAEMFAEFKTTEDAFGGNLLDQTVIPCVTEVAETTHSRSPTPALIVGGKALGMKGGQFHNFENAVRHHNDLWATVAQPFLKTNNPVGALSQEVFRKDGVAPIAGLWEPVSG